MASAPTEGEVTVGSVDCRVKTDVRVHATPAGIWEALAAVCTVHTGGSSQWVPFEDGNVTITFFGPELERTGEGK